MYKTKGEIIFNDVDLSKYFVVEKIERPIIAKIKNNYRNIPQRQGVYFISEYRAEKIVNVTVRIVNDDHTKITEIKDNIISVLGSENLGKLELADEPNKYEMAKLDGDIEIERLFKGAEFTLFFLNPSGIFYSKEISTGLENKGNTPTYWTLEGVVSDTDTITILDEETSEKIIIDAKDFHQGETLKVVSEFEHIYIGNELVMGSLYVESDFPMMKAGKNNFKVQGLDSFEFKHRDRWL